MTSQTIALPGARMAAPAPGHISQATAVEQSRAVAEVQAAVVVAQANPRDIDRALADMRDTCGRLPVASRAFYAVPNRGSGMSVHLMRELARIWGNVDYGVRELRRDDNAGESEMQAWAWDQQTNTRSTRSFIQPHQRMKGKERQALTDLNDIYLSNQNTGARAVRECVSSVLPDWLLAEAEAICRRTLEHGEGKSAEVRSKEAVAAFAAIGVTRAQLEEHAGAKYGKWDPAILADLTRVYTSITQEGIPAGDFFTERTTSLAAVPVATPLPVATRVERATGGTVEAESAPVVGDYNGPDQMDPVEPLAATQKQVTAVNAALTAAGCSDREAKLDKVSEIVGRPVESSKYLTREEAGAVLDRLSYEAQAREAGAEPEDLPEDLLGGMEPEGTA